MKSPGDKFLAPGLLLLCTLPIACATPSSVSPQTAPIVQSPPTEDHTTIRPVNYLDQSEMPELEAALPSPREVPYAQTAVFPQGAPFAGMSVLSLDALVQAVLDRNPSLTQMVAAWEAATTRYPQVTSLEDPMFGGTIGPATFGSNDVNFAYIANISQKIPFPGKLRLRGEAARAEASAAGQNVEDMRLQLVESARIAFFDYYLIDRALSVNQEGMRLLQDFRASAVSRYKSGKASEQDYRQADVEIGQLEERRLTLKRMGKVAIARINTLMHLPPDSLLPPPPREVAVTAALPDVQTLRAAALAQRPDLRALADRVTADQARVALAYKDYCPDFTPYFEFNRFMGNTSQTLPLAYFLGVSMNLPVYRQRLHAAVREARAKLAERQAELARQTDQVNYQVQQAYEEVRESEQAVRLYEDKILRAARANLAAARDAYTAGTIPFLSLIEAERNLINLRDRYYEAVAEYHRRRATLERVVGGPLTM